MTAFGSSTCNGENIEEGVRHDSSRAEDQRVSEKQGTNRVKLSLLKLQFFRRRWETSPLRCTHRIEKKCCSVNLQDSRSIEWKKGDKMMHLRIFSSQETAKSASSKYKELSLSLVRARENEGRPQKK